MAVRGHRLVLLCTCTYMNVTMSTSEVKQDASSSVVAAKPALTKRGYLTYAEMGYVTAPPKERWAPEGKGIRCGTCKFLRAPNEGNGIWHCALMQHDDKHNKNHEQGCCNFWNDKDTSISPDFLSGQEAIRVLGFDKLLDIEDLAAGGGASGKRVLVPVRSTLGRPEKAPLYF